MITLFLIFSSAAPLLSGQKVEYFKVPDLEKILNSREDKLYVVNFWATWCPPCRHEVPLLVSTYERSHAAGVEIVGISLDKDRSALLEFIRQNGVVWPQYFDGKGWDNNISRRFGVKSIPDTILVDRQGIVRHLGLRGADLDTAVAKLLAEAD